MTDVADAKKAARAAALALRETLHRHRSGAGRQAAAHALRVIGALRDVRMVAAYLPFRSEIDPRPAMLALSGLGFDVCVPVIDGRGLPLRFRVWTPGALVTRGAFGVAVPAEGVWASPDALLLPMLAFDAEGWRLGYGGGFYDRTLSQLRAERPIAALGFAYAGQEVAAVPHDATDARLDALVTETGSRWVAPARSLGVGAASVPSRA